MNEKDPNYPPEDDAFESIEPIQSDIDTIDERITTAHEEIIALVLKMLTESIAGKEVTLNPRSFTVYLMNSGQNYLTSVKDLITCLLNDGSLDNEEVANILAQRICSDEKTRSEEWSAALAPHYPKIPLVTEYRDVKEKMRAVLDAAQSSAEEYADELVAPFKEIIQTDINFINNTLNEIMRDKESGILETQLGDIIDYLAKIARNTAKPSRSDRLGQAACIAASAFVGSLLARKFSK